MRTQSIDARGQSLVLEKLSNEYISAQIFGTFDSTPDIDGVVHFQDGKGSNLKAKLHFQLKSSENLSKNKFYCRRAVLEYLSSTNIPTLLLVADVNEKKLYWYILKI